MALKLYSGKIFDYEKMKSKADAKKKSGEPPKYIVYKDKRHRDKKKINPKWRIWKENQKNKPTKTENKTTKTETKKTATFKESIKAGEELNKTIKASDKKPKNKLKIKPTTEGGPVKDGVKYARSKGDDLAGYRRGKGTRLGKDTRITKKLKKSGFTEDRLARLRKRNAEFQAAKKDKKKMKAYREKYGK